MVDLPDHTYELGLKLGQRPVQVVKCIAPFRGLHLVDYLVREVYVTLDQVHVVHELGVLAWERCLLLRFVSRAAFRVHVGL